MGANKKPVILFPGFYRVYTAGGYGSAGYDAKHETFFYVSAWIGNCGDAVFAENIDKWWRMLYDNS
jgi:hypothetical protein